MIIVGENSYVTIEEATEYIAARYSPKNILRVHWECATPDHREMYLFQSLEEIEALPFIGRKTFYSNLLQFPRDINGMPVRITHHPLFRANFGNANVVPAQVKQAQIENALGIIRKSYRPGAAALALHALGAVPQYEDTGRLSSTRAERLLAPFLGSLKA